MANITMYHGKECPHCAVMRPLVAKLEKEEKIKIDKKEVWHDNNNAEEMRSHKEIISRDCDGDLGVPCFFSTKTKKACCGEMPYEELKDWVKKNN